MFAHDSHTYAILFQSWIRVQGEVDNEHELFGRRRESKAFCNRREGLRVIGFDAVYDSKLLCNFLYLQTITLRCK